MTNDSIFNVDWGLGDQPLVFQLWHIVGLSFEFRKSLL